MATHSTPSSDPGLVPTDATARGRQDLLAWRQAWPTNFYDCNEALQDLVASRAGATADPGLKNRLSEFGQAMALDAEPLVHRCSTAPHTPTLERYGPLGDRQELVNFDSSYHDLGALIYGSGVMGLTDRRDRAVEQAALVLLASHHGEAGHVCPLACTAGMIKVMGRTGHPWLRDRYLPALTDPAYNTRMWGSQFLTEVQGGSDVGSNACTATMVRPGDGDRPALWSLEGEKWFCSVADASLFLVTARPAGAVEGTRGLGLFVVPRRLGVDELGPDAGPERVNHFTLRRLKDKLGTRAMASAELDWNGALAWQVGEIDRGFANVVGVVLNTSRLFNALACAGAMWRAFWIAERFCRHRHAFGRPIGGFPLVKNALATLYAEAVAATASSLDLIAMEGDPARESAWRLGLNMNKYWTSIRNTRMQCQAIEVLGGNGTIEDFSPLPRLYRDAMVTESWEGTHNVLAAQCQRDMHRYRLHQAFIGDLLGRLGGLQGEVADALSQRLQTLATEAAELAQDMDEARTVALRRWIDRVMVVYQGVCLLELARWQRRAGRTPMPEAVPRHLLATHPDLPLEQTPLWWPGIEG